MATRLQAALLCILFSLTTHSQDLNFEESSGSGEVILEKAEDYSLPYKERRGTHGVLFSVGMEKFYPVDYRSLFNDSHVEEIIKEDRISLVGAELGYKYNFTLGSVAILGTYASGAADGSFGGSDRNLAITKYGLSGNFALDAFLNEPWIVPYVQGGIHQFLIAESGINGDQSATANIAFNYKFGLMFQLDWLENAMDKSSKVDRLRSSGLENTFIDVFMTEYLASSGAIDPADAFGTEGDPNLRSSAELGVALKLEF